MRVVWCGALIAALLAGVGPAAAKPAKPAVKASAAKPAKAKPKAPAPKPAKPEPQAAAPAEEEGPLYAELSEMPTIRGHAPVAYVCPPYERCGYALRRRLYEAWAMRPHDITWHVLSDVGGLTRFGAVDVQTKRGGGTRWVARRPVIDEAELGEEWIADMPLGEIARRFKAFGGKPGDEAWLQVIESYEPNLDDLVIQHLRPDEEIADSDTCPSFAAAMKGLENLGELKPDIRRLGRGRVSPDDPAARPGAAFTLTIRDVQIEETLHGLTLGGSYGSLPARWIMQAERALEPCWRPAPREKR
jgi:hypothetical protein